MRSAELENGIRLCIFHTLHSTLHIFPIQPSTSPTISSIVKTNTKFCPWTYFIFLFSRSYIHNGHRNVHSQMSVGCQAPGIDLHSQHFIRLWTRTTRTYTYILWYEFPARDGDPSGFCQRTAITLDVQFHGFRGEVVYLGAVDNI